MNAEFVAVGIHYNRCPAARHVERLRGELHSVTFEMLDCSVEVVHFQHEVGTVARWLQEWFISDAERVRASCKSTKFWPKLSKNLAS